jgi:4-alpha-glucanotransferase
MPVPGDRRRRHAGVIVPTFSLRSARDWGVGEIPDLGGMAAWLADAGQASLHTLPLLERAAHERSPYSALSAFAIDPIHLGLDQLQDFVASGGRAALSEDDRQTIARLRGATTIDYDAIRSLKHRALERAYASFVRTELASDGERGRRFYQFERDEAGWLADYALYRALYAEHGDAGWRSWPDLALQAHDARACAAARDRLAERVRYFAWVQWLVHEQLRDARRVASEHGVEIVGDLPFTVAVESADVWARQHDFDVGVSIGAPPDAFNDDGQDWALPAFRWDVVRGGGFAWLCERVGHIERWLDGARLDHIVGYFRTFVRPPHEPPHFEPPEPRMQRELGAAALDAARDAARGRRLLAEDLGDVPDFVREEMAERSLPGYRVLRWENDGPVFRDPRAFPACSIATTGTHDTSSLAAWWSDELDDAGRRALAEVPPFAALQGAGPELTPAVHEALVDGLYAAGSDTALLLVQDLFGSRERINTPATIADANWSWRLPEEVERLTGPAGRERSAWLRTLARRHGRAE